jgi:hypothetical protein
LSNKNFNQGKKMKYHKFYSLIITSLLFFTLNTYAADDNSTATTEPGFYATPIQLALFAPLQLAPVDSDVYGLKLSLPYGVNRILYGIGAGLCSVDQEVYGLDVGGWNVVKGNQYGIQIGGLFASRGNAESISYGLNIAGLVNLSKGSGYGISIAGIVNYATDTLTGLQLACCTYAEKITGLQLGVVNYADDLTGVQLGLVNICPKGYLPFMIVINGKF